MADDLRRGAEESLLLRFEEFRVEIEPAGQAPVVERVGFRGYFAQFRRHLSAFTPSNHSCRSLGRGPRRTATAKRSEPPRARTRESRAPSPRAGLRRMFANVRSDEARIE